jgi:uncharacterized membrane protein YozB (DUF420 family)
LVKVTGFLPLARTADTVTSSSALTFVVSLVISCVKPTAGKKQKAVMNTAFVLRVLYFVLFVVNKVFIRNVLRIKGAIILGL